MRISIVVLALALLGSCDGVFGQDVDAPLCVLDCDGGPGDGPPQDTVRFRLTERPATALYRYEDNLAVTAGRSFRVAVEHPRTVCDLPAMTRVDIDTSGRAVTIVPRIFARIPGGCPDAATTRVVTLSLDAGTWTIAAGSAAPITITVGPMPGRPCGLSPCSLDCDCDLAAGERCLGGQGLGGEFLSCVRPCEYDRDCGGTGACLDLADGHLHTCQAADECGATYPCPTGFACSPDNVCDPTFTLTQSTRHECSTDQDCAVGMHCAEATVAGGGPHRCEALCRSDGAWCQGAHMCGPASADNGNLARTDSICGFLGE